MIVPLLIATFIACIATYLCVNATEEIVKVAAASVALIFLLLSINFTPLFIKLLLILFLLVPFIGKKLSEVKLIGQD